jgi:5'-3' exonuclease
MGIPSYFAHIIKKNPQIVMKIDENKPNIHNLYMDCNSIIYDCYRLLLQENPNYLERYSVAEFEAVLILRVADKIEEHICCIYPTETVYIAYDGVAPVAKMEQQRQRRYKSSFMSMLEERNKQAQNGYSTQSSTTTSTWDKTVITPGTKFMEKLAAHTHNHFRTHEVSNSLSAKEIIISTSEDSGEGEHKIFAYMRDTPDKHSNQTSVIYGLDADLIMLSLNHLAVSPVIFLYRESNEILTQKGYNDAAYLYNIPLLEDAVIVEMYDGNKVAELTNKSLFIHDYIFMCFMLGNDFMPHIPYINLRTRGSSILPKAYKEVFGGKHMTAANSANADGNFITNSGDIIWNNVFLYLHHLTYGGDNNYPCKEDKLITDEYKIRDKMAKGIYKQQIARTQGRSEAELTAEEKLLFLPIKDRRVEQYIDPFRPHWRNRYYTTLFDFTETHTSKAYQSNIDTACKKYLEGLEWTHRYYRNGCIDWDWHYPYEYSPLLSDVVKFMSNYTQPIQYYGGCDKWKEGKTISTPVSPITQLAYVLPVSSQHVLPMSVKDKLQKKLSDKYPTYCEWNWAFCKYFWEAHAKLPSISVAVLKRLLK